MALLLALGCSAPDAGTTADDIVAVSRLMVTLDRVTSGAGFEELADCWPLSSFAPGDPGAPSA